MRFLRIWLQTAKLSSREIFRVRKTIGKIISRTALTFSKAKNPQNLIPQKLLNISLQKLVHLRALDPTSFSILHQLKLQFLHFEKVNV